MKKKSETPELLVDFEATVRQEVVYLSGPMTGDADYVNKFDRAATVLRSDDYAVINPAETDPANGDWFDWMKQDVADILRTDLLVLLPGWEDSVGSRFERALAVATGVPVYEFEWHNEHDWTMRLLNPPNRITARSDLAELIGPFDEVMVKVTEVAEALTPQETLLQTADRIVSTDRQDDYGHPFDDFTRTGKMWAAILGIDDVSPEEVGLMMAALKISRLVNQYKDDSVVDLAGYAKTVSLVHERRLEQERALSSVDDWVERLDSIYGLSRVHGAES